MKSKFFNLLTVSLATSVLLVSVPKAFGQSVEFQTNLTEPQPLMFDVDLSRTAGSIGTQGQASEKTASFPTTAASQPTQQSKANSAQESDRVSNTLGGFVVTFVFISYILIGLQYRKHRLHRAAILLQQIETLERIWNMEPHR
ncbi:MAG TPA: hypothetical protein V6D35_04535 [Candidatus Sericytochromatia bacterium]